jgi:ubiquinone/menaquinone biosynthesis C-methylase UbiE
VKETGKAPKAQIRDGYDRWSEIYDQEANPLIGLEEPVVKEAVGDVAGLAVLDLGCGTGRHALWMAAAGASVTAIDFSEGMMEKARAKPGAGKVRFLVHDLNERLPFDDRSFDRVVSGLVLEHLRDMAPLFSEAHRVLKPGGRAVVSGMHPAMFLRDVRARFRDPATGEKVEPGSIEHTIGDVVMAAVRAGFALAGIDERAPDAQLAVRYPRAGRYLGWPMLIVLRLHA